MTQLVLLNDTLRLDDNCLLSTTSPSLAVVVVDNQQFFGKQYGIYRSNLHRLRARLAAINHLQQQLAAQQIGLVVRFGETVDELRKLADQINAKELLAAEPVAPEEQQWFAQLGARLNVKLVDLNSLLGPGLAPIVTQLPDRFTTFRKQLEPLLKVSPPQKGSASLDASLWLTPAQAIQFSQDALLQQWLSHASDQPTTELAAQQRLDNFIWQRQAILHYKESRNALDGEYYASFFSAPLAAGSLSARRIWQQICQFEQEISANDSTYWLKFELLWREFFRWQMRKYQARWFSQTGIRGASNFSAPQLSQRQRSRFEQWCSGTTGVPFIDANMRLLNQHGVMSNRGRQNVASYLIHDLDVDWRLGAAYFEQRLHDYDAASNWGNWAYIGGWGNSEARPFNIIKQALWYDPQAEFVCRWLPELKSTGKSAHRPRPGTAIPHQWQSWLEELD